MHQEALKRRIEQLLAIPGNALADQAFLYNGALGVMGALYGQDSAQEKQLRSMVQGIWGNDPQHGFRVHKATEAIKGVLASIKAEVDGGFIGSLRATIAGGVLTDLIKLARAVLDESGDDAKNVASVLAAAAFEDTLRKLADLSGLPAQDKLADIVAGLKDANVLKGAQVGTAQSYLSFRNRALHAKFAEVDRATTHSVLSFTEQILVLHFA